MENLLLGLSRDSYLSALEELREQFALVKIEVDVLLLPAAHPHLFVQQVHYVLLQGLVLLLPFLLQIVDVFVLVHVYLVHLEVKHVELILKNLLGLLLHGLSPLQALLDQQVDVLILDIARPHPEDLVSSIVDHVLQIVLLEVGVLGGQPSLLDDE